jgi:tetratricopeptide (TPR) repeat protein
MELDAGDAIYALGGRDWERHRQELEKLGGLPGQINHSPETPRAWHLREAASSEQAGQWFAARWHLDRLIAATPEDGSLYARRGLAIAWLGLWDEAEKDYGKAIELGADRSDLSIYNRRGVARAWLGRWAEAEKDYSLAIERGVDQDDSQIYSSRGVARARLGRWAEADADFVVAIERRAVPIDWFAHALMRLHLGDMEGYRAACERMLEHLDESEDPSTAHAIADTCATAPEAVADLGRPVRLAERAMASDPKNWGYVETLGATLYRAGRYEEALVRLEESARLSGDQQGSVRGWLFRAMAHDRLGHTDEARRWLDQAVGWIEREVPKRPEETARIPSLSLRQSLAYQLLRREAEAQIKERRPLYLPANVFQDDPAPTPPRSSQRR